MGDGLFVCDTTSVEVRDLYSGFVQEHSDLLGRMIESCRHWQNTFATHLQFRCDELRGCRCKSFFNHAVWRDTYEPFVTEMHRWNANIQAHLRDRSCLIENSETFPEFRHKYLRLATAILEWQGRHADNQENYLSESLCTPCFETSSRVHHQALEFLYFQRRPTLDISIGDEILPAVEPGICRGCRNLLHPLYARRVPPPTNPLGLTRRFAARCQAYYYLGSHRTGKASSVPEGPVAPQGPYTPLHAIRCSENPAASSSSSSSSSSPSRSSVKSSSTYYEAFRS